MFAFPPLTSLVKRLLIALGVTFVLEVLATYALGLPVAELLALFPHRFDVSLAWQIFTWPLVHVATPGSQWRVILDAVFFWLIVSPFENRFGPRRALQALGAGWLGATIAALVVGLFVALVLGKPVGALFGLQCLVFSVLVASVSVVRVGSVSLFGVLPMKPWHAIAFALGLSALNFVMTRDAVPFAGDVGAVIAGYLFARWMTTPRGSRKSVPTRVPRTSGFRIIEGGKPTGDDDKPKWLN